MTTSVSALIPFNPHSKEHMRQLVPVGAVGENGSQQLVGVLRDGPVDPHVSWIAGASGSGKTWLALSQMVTLAETGQGFLYMDPSRSATRDIKRYTAGRHAERMVELDMNSTNEAGERLSVGWNPLDLTVVPPELRRERVRNLRERLPAILFPAYFGKNSMSVPRTASIIRKALECLLELNNRLPSEIQGERILHEEPSRGRGVARIGAEDATRSPTSVVEGLLAHVGQ